MCEVWVQFGDVLQLIDNDKPLTSSENRLIYNTLERETELWGGQGMARERERPWDKYKNSKKNRNKALFSHKSEHR